MQRAIRSGIVFRAQGIGRADRSAVQGLFDQAPEILGFSKLHQPTERSVRIGGRRVEQHSRHG